MAIARNTYIFSTTLYCLRPQLPDYTRDRQDGRHTRIPCYICNLNQTIPMHPHLQHCCWPVSLWHLRKHYHSKLITHYLQNVIAITLICHVRHGQDIFLFCHVRVQSGQDTCTLANTQRIIWKLPRPYPKAVRSSLLLQGKGIHSYILHHTRPDYTVSRQHHNSRLHIRHLTTWPPSVTLHSQSLPSQARTLTETQEPTPPSTNNTLPEPSVGDSPPSGKDVTHRAARASLRKYHAIPINNKLGHIAHVLVLVQKNSTGGG
jgi:hypothetical protein